jgi:hypothetical protein
MLDIRSIQAASGAQCVQLGTSREPPQHSLGKVVQRSDAGLHGYIVLMAETIVPPPMHPLRPVREGIENPQLPAQQFPNFLRLEDQALSGSRLPCRIREHALSPSAYADLGRAPTFSDTLVEVTVAEAAAAAE